MCCDCVPILCPLQLPFADFLHPPTALSPPARFLYYTAPLEAWSPSGLVDDVTWTDLAVADKVTSLIFYYPITLYFPTGLCLLFYQTCKPS